ncbi:putative Haloacid dehalogenase [Seiridium cardinale]|uniref:Haloacid dehalogenase n=1 Tax=Seiridium cardinale TaxID=138064 RepID=A0ABR2XP00_9PEZI
MAQSEYPDLTSFKALSFDCYGTLIDWESGLLNALRALTSQLPSSHRQNEDPPVQAMQRFDLIVTDLQSRQRHLLYNELLVSAATKLAHEFGIEALSDAIAAPLGNAPGTSAAFPDTVSGLQKLKKYYKLAILSNVDNQNIKSTVEKQLEGVEFDGVYTAQDVGTFKPDKKNFEYLFGHARQDLGVDARKGELLHVARSLKVDHVPCKELGLRSVWISRGAEKGVGGIVKDELSEFKESVGFEWRFDTIGKFADEVERQFKAKQS